MTTETTTTANGEAAKQAWEAAAAESAALQVKNAAPPPRKYKRILAVRLPDGERIEIGLQAQDASRQLEIHDERTKEVVTERKAERMKLVARAKELGDIFTTGRVQREVECREDVSFETNSRRITRLDTGELVSEDALSSSERQALLPLPEAKPKDTQLALGNVAEAAEPAASEADSSADGDQAADITDPEGLLDAATGDEDEDDAEGDEDE